MPEMLGMLENLWNLENLENLENLHLLQVNGEIAGLGVGDVEAGHA